MAALTTSYPITSFTKAIQAEVWEDTDEAIEHYTTFLAAFSIICKSYQSRSELSKACKLLVMVELRIAGLASHLGTCSVEVKDLKKLKPYISMKTGFSEAANVLFRPEIFTNQTDRLQELYDELNQGVNECNQIQKEKDDLLQIQKRLTICIERIGEKNVADMRDNKDNALPVYYVKPFIRVHLYDCQNGNEIEPYQDTKSGSRDRSNPQHIKFMEDIQFTTELAKCIEMNYVVFFEFIYRNKKTGKDETCCWCCLEMDEIKLLMSNLANDNQNNDGGVPLLLEWYSLPFDVNRKKLKLHTRKELYMNVVVLAPPNIL